MDRRLVVLGLLALIAMGGFSSVPGTLEYRLYREIATPTFSVAGFVLAELPRTLSLGIPAQPAAAAGEDIVRRYLAALQQIATPSAEADRSDRSATAEHATPTAAQEVRRTLEPLAERTIAMQVAAILGAEGLGLGGGDLFPPVRFVFREPPLVLVVSPRDRIALRAALPLAQNLEQDAMAQVEARAERLGVSALVVRIGGLATYPAMLPPASDLAWLLEAVAHEWTHNYFSLRPLGWRYALGLERDPAVITVNETAADLIGREVGRRVLSQLYGQTAPDESPSAKQADQRTARFRARMREIRTQADTLLTAGQVDAAERLMEEQRQALWREGFALRKLNQAYFAFHGSYAEGPAGLFDPVVADVKLLRARLPSLRAFAETVSTVTGADELRALVQR